MDNNDHKPAFRVLKVMMIAFDTDQSPAAFFRQIDQFPTGVPLRYRSNCKLFLLHRLTFAFSASGPAESFRFLQEPHAGGGPAHGVDTHPGLLRCLMQRYGGSTQYHPHKEETWMNFYTRQHKHYCGIDLHA